MATFYARSSDNLAPNATATVSSGTIDTTYGVNNVKDLDPSLPMKFTTTSGRIVLDFGSAQTIRLASLIHHNLAGATVTLQANATNSWGAPSFSQAFTIPAAKLDGFGVNPFLDLRTAAPNYRYFSLNVTGAPAVWGVGEIILASQCRTFPGHISPGTKEEDIRQIYEHTTEYGVALIYDRGVNSRTWEMSMIVRKSGLDEMKQLWQDARGRSKGFTFIRDSSINEAVFCRFKNASLPNVRSSQEVYPVTFFLEEISMGLKIA